MQLKYHYSILGNFLFLIFGLFLLGVGLDLLFLNLFIKLNINTTPPAFVLWITTLLGFLTFSGSLINLIKGKNYALKADNKGLTVFTKSIDGKLPKIFISWSDIQDINAEWIKSLFRGPRGEHRKVLKIKIKSNLIQWPPWMITKNRVSFKKCNNYDEITIDAWLNKSNKKIVEELELLKNQVLTK